MNWVKELKIINCDGVFNKNSRQWENNCGIINLDSNYGPGTHWVCYVDSFYFDPFGLPPPVNILFIKRYNTSQYQKRYPFFVVTFVFVFLLFFFIKKFHDGNSIYNILYRILDQINPSKNETILKEYFIKGMFNNEIKKKEVIKKTLAFYLNYRRVTTQSGLRQLVKRTDVDLVEVKI